MSKRFGSPIKSPSKSGAKNKSMMSASAFSTPVRPGTAYQKTPDPRQVRAMSRDDKVNLLNTLNAGGKSSQLGGSFATPQRSSSTAGLGLAKKRPTTAGGVGRQSTLASSPVYKGIFAGTSSPPRKGKKPEPVNLVNLVHKKDRLSS